MCRFTRQKSPRRTRWPRRWPRYRPGCDGPKMGERTDISWTDHTFNPWWGCTKVGPGCDHCYAEALALRFGTRWGVGQPRRFFGDKHWNEPRRWHKKALAVGNRRRVFCASMADVFDNEVEQEHRERLWSLI